jgi:hypothetical protein
VETEPVPDAERGAQLVGGLLKVWPAKEAPLRVHVVFCEQLQAALAPWLADRAQVATWFDQLNRELSGRLKALRQLEKSAREEADKTRSRLKSRGQPGAGRSSAGSVAGHAMTGTKLLVHGYIRMEEPDETEIALMSKDIGSYCMLNDYRLGSIFIDRGVPDDVFARNGFINLLDAVRSTGAHAVVVLTVDHLSLQAFIQDALRRMVEQAHANVLVIYETNGGSAVVEGGHDLDWPGASS